jgi:hypothetical protein
MFAASHQLPIHNCHGCEIYIRCGSQPIKEDCSDMGFAPCALRYAQTESDRSEAGLFQVACWDNVVHFSTSKVYWFYCRLSETRNIVCKRN